MIREYVVWSLGEIGGKDAKEVLEERLLKDQSDNVRQSIAKALIQV